MLREAITVADQIRRAVMSKELMKRSTGEHLGRVTISIGVATLQTGDTTQSLIERADSCLYAAKRNGRNRVICETDPEVSSRRPSRRWPERQDLLRFSAFSRPCPALFGDWCRFPALRRRAAARASRAQAASSSGSS